MSTFSNRHLSFGQMIVWFGGCILIQIASAIPVDDIFTTKVSIVLCYSSRLKRLIWIWICTRDFESKWYLFCAINECLLLCLCFFLSFVRFLLG